MCSAVEIVTKLLVLVKEALHSAKLCKGMVDTCRDGMLEKVPRWI